MKLFHEDIGREFIIMQAGTSEGTQIKYRKDGYWYKKDNHGHEGLAEYGAGVRGAKCIDVSDSQI